MHMPGKLVRWRPSTSRLSYHETPLHKSRVWRGRIMLSWLKTAFVWQPPFLPRCDTRMVVNTTFGFSPRSDRVGKEITSLHIGPDNAGINLLLCPWPIYQSKKKILGKQTPWGYPTMGDGMVSRCKCIYQALLCRLYKFAKEARNSNNIINRILLSVALNGSKSSVSRSLLHLGAYVNETCAYLLIHIFFHHLEN